MENILSNFSSPFLAAIAIGLSCGTGCSPVISLFLTTHIMGNSNNIKKGLMDFLHFFLGKTSVIVALGLLSGLLGKAVFGKTGTLFGFDLRLTLDIFLIMSGLIPIIKMIVSNKQKTCKECSHSCAGHGKIKMEKVKQTGIATFLIGAAYGITPCTPLIVILALDSLTGPFKAVPVSILFSIASSISPLILLAALAGFFSKKMHDEIPQFIGVFQLFSFLIITIAGCLSLFFHIR